MTIQQEKKALECLRMFEPDECYILGYSGGKDSDVVLGLSELSGVKYKAVHNLTTVDAPETVNYIKSQPQIEILHPEITMWKLIEKMKYPPTRIVRYCCAELKEKSNIGRITITGVRKGESENRKNNQGLITFPQKDDVARIADELDINFLSTDKGGVVLNNDNDESRRLVEQCYRTHKTLVNPIIEWSDSDVWEFLRHYSIDGNPLYQCGFDRIGCIGCPMANKQRYAQFKRYPKYRLNYVKAFDRMIQRRIETDMPQIWNNGKECMRWWLGENPNQLEMFERW